MKGAEFGLGRTALGSANGTAWTQSPCELPDPSSPIVLAQNGVSRTPDGTYDSAVSSGLVHRLRLTQR